MINLADEALSCDDKIPVLRFNPWLFSGADKLVGFFSEMAIRLGQSPQTAVKGIAKNVACYGRVLRPLNAVAIAGALVTALEEFP